MKAEINFGFAKTIETSGLKIAEAIVERAIQEKFSFDVDLEITIIDPPKEEVCFTDITKSSVTFYPDGEIKITGYAAGE